MTSVYDMLVQRVGCLEDFDIQEIVEDQNEYLVFYDNKYMLRIWFDEDNNVHLVFFKVVDEELEKIDYQVIESLN